MTFTAGADYRKSRRCTGGRTEGARGSNAVAGRHQMEMGSATARGRTAGNRAVEKFRLPFGERDKAGGFAPGPGDCGSGKNAFGAFATAGILTVNRID